MNEMIAWHDIESQLRLPFLECHQIKISWLQDQWIRDVLNDVVGELRQFLCQTFDLGDRVLDESVTLCYGCQLETEPKHLLSNLAVLCVT